MKFIKAAAIAFATLVIFAVLDVLLNNNGHSFTLGQWQAINTVKHLFWIAGCAWTLTVLLSRKKVG